MEEQQRLGRPPVEVINVAMRRIHGSWHLSIQTRAEGVDVWDRFRLDSLGTGDLLEAVVVELQRRLL